MTRSTVDVCACRLKKHPKVAEWINHYRHNGAMLSREQHLAELGRLKDVAIQQGNSSAAITAESLRGKVSRLYVDQVEISDTRKISAADVAEAVASGDPEAVRALADKLDSIPSRMH